MKKKSLFLGVILICLLVMTGCSNDSEKTMTCKRSLDQNGTKTNLAYAVTYKGDYVKRVKSEETIETEESSLLENYKSQVEKLYSPYNGIEHYDYKVEIVDKKLISTVDINYEKIDTDKLIKIDSANGSLIKDGKIKVKDMKSLYEQLGATCE